MAKERPSGWTLKPLGATLQFARPRFPLTQGPDGASSTPDPTKSTPLTGEICGSTALFMLREICEGLAPKPLATVEEPCWTNRFWRMTRIACLLTVLSWPPASKFGIPVSTSRLVRAKDALGSTRWIAWGCVGTELPSQSGLTPGDCQPDIGCWCGEEADGGVHSD